MRKVMPSLKILTWNINGLRACRIPLKQQLDNLDADVICLQETKVTRDQLEEVTAIIDGYNSYFSFSKVRSGYSGVATYVRDSATPTQAEDGLSGACGLPGQQVIGSYGHGYEDFTQDELIKLDSEGRCIITQHSIRTETGVEESLAIINVYCPRVGVDNADRLEFKMQFYRLLKLRAEAILNHGSHVIILGDINTVHKKIDHCNPDDDAEFYANPGRQWMDSFVSSSQVDDLNCKAERGCHRFFDTFRWLHPNELNAFTNWCSATGARQTNYGCRLDYIIADLDMLPWLRTCRIMADIDGSDHCPVKVEFEGVVVGASSCPSICTKYFPQFSGRQQKLAQFLVRKSSSQCSNSSKSSANTDAPLTDSSQDVVNNRTLDDCTVSRGSEEQTAIRSCASAGTKRLAAGPVSHQLKKAKSDGASGKQSNLLNFFGQARKRKETGERGGESPSRTAARLMPTADQTELLSNTDNTSTKLHSEVDTGFKLPEESVSAWKCLLKGPPQTPLCTGHQEPSVLRTVKKIGPNKGRQFWTCNRPEGHKTNRDARCDYFVWVPRK